MGKVEKAGKTSRRRFVSTALSLVALGFCTFCVWARNEAPREWKSRLGKTVVTGAVDVDATFADFPSGAEKPETVYFQGTDGKRYKYRYSLLDKAGQELVDVALGLSAEVVGDGTGESLAQPANDGESGPGKRALAVVPKDCVRRAVLVGVDDYAEFSDLRFAGADVERVRERLVEFGFAPENIVALTTENGRSNSAFAPTQRNIERELSRILNASGPDDMVFIMFTGHGLQTDEFAGYAPYVGFAPSDATANAETVVDFATTISLSKLFDDLNACKAKFKWALIDACRENLSEGKKSLDDSKRLRPLDAPAGVIVLHSCAAKEFSYEDEEFGHGLFTYYFTESLNDVGDANEDGVVTMTEAFSRAQALVRKRTNGAGYARIQTPYCRGDFTDFPLADVKTAEAKKRWRAAVKAREKGDYATALEEIDAALALMPEKSEYASEKRTIKAFAEAERKAQAAAEKARREAESAAQAERERLEAELAAAKAEAEKAKKEAERKAEEESAARADAERQAREAAVAAQVEEERQAQAIEAAEGLWAERRWLARRQKEGEVKRYALPLVGALALILIATHTLLHAAICGALRKLISNKLGRWTLVSVGAFVWEEVWLEFVWEEVWHENLYVDSYLRAPEMALTEWAGFYLAATVLFWSASWGTYLLLKNLKRLKENANAKRAFLFSPNAIFAVGGAVLFGALPFTFYTQSLDFIGESQEYYHALFVDPLLAGVTIGCCLWALILFARYGTPIFFANDEERKYRNLATLRLGLGLASFAAYAVWLYRFY